MGAHTTHPLRRRWYLWPLAAASVIGMIVAGTTTGIGPTIIAAVAVLVALITVGCYLWWTAPDRPQAKSNLGTGLLVSVVVGAAVGSAQFAIDERRRASEDVRKTTADNDATRLQLLTTVGLRKHLEDFDFSDRPLTKFPFVGKVLLRANFERADLRDAQLAKANLRFARFEAADLRSASLVRADLRAAELKRAKLNGVDANNSTFVGADLAGADLLAAKLDGARLLFAFLGGADLVGASLIGANLTKANLGGASLCKTDLREATLDGANFAGAIFDAATRWPSGFDARAAKAVRAKPHTKCKAPPVARPRPRSQG